MHTHERITNAKLSRFYSVAAHSKRCVYNTLTFSHDTVCDWENASCSALRESTTPTMEMPEAEVGQLRGGGLN